MNTLTPEGRRLVQDLARRHGFGEDAVTRMLAAVIAGNGRMAQFAHPELGGSGQWMSGGMLMIGDMFDHALKGRVGGLCADLSKALAAADTPFFTPSPSSSWWPEALGTPSATGSQNSTRYAYFADACRLVLDTDGDLTVHDTLDHRIGGFSQQQGGRGGISMTSQHGTFDPVTLPVVSRDGQPSSSSSSRSATPTSPVVAQARSGAVPPGPDAPAAADPGSGAGAAVAESGGSAKVTHEDPLQLIERLGQLHERGLLTDEEFSAKKGELLARL